MKNKILSFGLLWFFVTLFSFTGFSQSQVQIGTGTATAQRIPIEPWYDYTYSQVIYLQSEVSTAGYITQLKWYFYGSSLSNSNNWDIYIGHTTKTEFTSTTDWIPVSSLTQVWSGTFADPGASGWITFDITDFDYNNTENLIIAVDENAPDDNGSSDDFYCTSVADCRGLTKYGSSNIDPAAPPAGSRRSYIANIILEFGNTACPTPSNLAVTNILQTSADLGWTENGTATAWDIEYGATGFAQGTGTTITGVTSNPYTLSSLSAGTSYDWYVRASCGGSGQSNWAGPGSFKTLAPTQSMPYTEDWETGTIGSAWNYYTSSYAVLQTNTASKHNGTYGLEQYGDGGSYTTPSGLADAYAKAQLGGVNESHTSWNSFTVDLTTASSPELSFWYSLGRSYNNNYNFFWAQIDNGSGWIDLFSIQPSGSTIPYEKKTFDLSTYVGGTVNIRFFHNGKYDNDYLYLDDILVAEFTCPEPTDQTVSNIATTSVNLGWTENGTSTAWDIEWGAAGFTQGSGTTITGTTTNPHTLSGLSANTSYDWYVRSDCGGGSSSIWSGPHTFSTTINSFPWTEDFENSGDIPYGWSQEYVSGTHDWIFHTGGYNNDNPSTAHGGTYNACFSYISSGTKTKLITPQFDLSGQSNPQLSFWHTQAVYDGDQDELRVYYKTTSGGTWTLIPGAVFTSSITSWTQETFDIPSPSSTYYIAFEGLDNFGYGVCVDDVEVSVSSCPAPTGLLADNISQTSVNLNWTTGGATTWNIEWGATGFTQGAGTTITGTTSNPYSLSTLTAGTAYDFYVQDDCGGSQSSWTGPASFTTLCNAITVFPWSEDFENAGQRPDCWTEECNVGSHDWVFQDGGDTEPYYAHGGSYNAAFIHQSTGTSTKLILPQLDLSGLTNPQISFWHAQVEDIGDQDELRVYYKTSQGGSWTMIPGAEYTSNVSDWTQVTLNLPSANATYFVAFEGTDGWGQGVCIDDVVVDGTISCLPPTDLYADNITTTSANLNWTTGGATTWNIEWGIEGFTQGAGTMITGTTTNPYPLSGLSANTMYDFYVQDDCGGGSQSTWAGPHTFCAIITDFPWTEDFENSGNRPGCWTEEYVTGDKDWVFRTGGESNQPPEAHSGTYNAAFTTGSIGYKTRLITPTFDIIGLTTPKLKFWYTQADWNGYRSTLRVYYKTTHGGAWTLIPGGEFTTSVSEWTEVILSLPSPSATYQIAFESTDGGGYNNCVDDVRVYDNLPMTWISSTCTQNTDVCYKADYQQIIGIEIVTQDPGTPIEVTNFRVNMNGSTTYLGHLVNIRIYYTGTSSQFNLSNRFNPAAYNPSPGGSPENFDIAGSQTLAEGTNYFWLVVEVEQTAIAGELADAECLQITSLSRTVYIPTITAPAGSREIHADMLWTGTVSSDWNNASNWDPVGTPNPYIPIDIPSGTPNNLQLNGTLVIRGTGGDYHCYSLDILIGVTVTNTEEFYVFGEMEVDGTYTSTTNTSYPHQIYAGGCLTINTAGTVTIGNTVNGQADLIIGHNTSSGGSFHNIGGELYVDDQIYLHSNASVITGDASVIFAGKGGGGSAYSADQPATLYVEDGAFGNIMNITLKVCGKKSAGYYSVNILSADFDLSSTATLEICHGDYATHYDANVNIVDGVTMGNFIVNKPGNFVTVESNLNLSGILEVSPNAKLILETGNTISVN